MIENIVILGAGNLSTSLAIELHGAGYKIVQIYSRTYESASVLANKLGAEPIVAIEKIGKEADLYILALPDSVIPKTINELKQVNGIVTHTSGSTPIDILKNCKAKGYGVIYPFQTFSRNRILEFRNIPICIEANNKETLILLESIAKNISTSVIEMNGEQRRWLHLTGVFACNFTNHMLAQAYRIAAENNINFLLAKPLIEETIQKAFEGNPADFQTGPAIRNDLNTIENHLQMLSKMGLANLYKELSLSIQKMAKKLKE